MFKMATLSVRHSFELLRRPVGREKVLYLENEEAAHRCWVARRGNRKFGGRTRHKYILVLLCSVRDKHACGGCPISGCPHNALDIAPCHGRPGFARTAGMVLFGGV